MIEKVRLEIESMIPTIADDGLRANGLAEVRALRNAIYFNNLNSTSDAMRLVSVLYKIVDVQNLNLMEMAYEKLKYLGFESEVLPVYKDMGTTQLNKSIAGNYMNYFETRTGESQTDLLNKLAKIKEFGRH